MSIDPSTVIPDCVDSWKVGAVVEPGVRDVDVAEAWSGVATEDAREVPRLSGGGDARSQPVGQDPVPPRAPRPKRRRRFTLWRAIQKVWIPLLIVIVIGAGGLTVSRLHGIFGTEKRPPYADSQVGAAKPFDPKHLTYEVFGPPGTVAKVSYFDENADPKRIDEAHLPWSLTFAMTEASAVGSVVAQGDSDDIGCRIVVDGVVKAEKITHETNAFTFCALKAS